MSDEGMAALSELFSRRSIRWAAVLALAALVALVGRWIDRPSVVGFGDSITRGRREGAYLDYFPIRYQTVNLGKNGQATEGGLPRLRAWLGQNDAELVILIMGTNDAVAEKYDEDATVERLRLMVEAIQESDIDVVLASPPPIIDPKRQLADQRLARLAARLETVAVGKNVAFVDLYDVLRQQPDIEAAYTSDGVHLNHDLGDQLIASQLLAAAMKMLASDD